MLRMELATWAPQTRERFTKDTVIDQAELAKKGVPIPLSMRDPRFKPGMQQLWIDVAHNRSFGLIKLDHPKEPKDYLSDYNHLLGIANFELVNIIELNDVLASAKLAGKKEEISTLPIIQMEIATWPPENRAEVLKSIVPYIKKNGPPPLSIHNPDCNPSMLQILWDMLSNRSFAMGEGGPQTAEEIWRAYNPPGLVPIDFELVVLMEVADVLKIQGLL